MSKPARFLHPLWALFAIIVLAIPIGALLWPPPPPPERFGQIPELSLVDQDGQPFTRGTMADTVWVTDFIFTRCPDVCPTLSARLATLQPRIAEHSGAQPIRLLSVTVDPAFDTPEVLTAYGARFSAEPALWRLVTGDEPVVYAAIEGFKQLVDVQREAGVDVPDILHSRKFVLVDGQGEIRGFFDSTPEGLDTLWDAATWLSDHPSD
ncbi:MAG: protein SCO1/2 [Myxococcota bacterium]